MFYLSTKIAFSVVFATKAQRQKETQSTLETILYGYTAPLLRPKRLEVVTDEFGRIYLPNLGWLITQLPNHTLEVTSNQDGLINLLNQRMPTIFTFESIELIENTQIELLKYPIPLLKQFYYNTEQHQVEVEIEEISQKHRKNLNLAWSILKKYVPFHYDIIKMATNRVVVFNVDTYLRNSFATLSAQGIAFFNAYQDTYNEVFFVDDIAHQTGHIIFNALIYDVEKFLLVKPETIIENIIVENNLVETRDIHVIFHALYTYYTTFICLNECLKNDIFKDDKKHEALGRMKFYTEKCYRDMSLIESPSIERNKTNTLYMMEDLFTSDGLIIYNEIKQTLKSMIDKWYDEVCNFDMSNQPYNFTYSKFTELNPYQCSTQNVFA